MITPIGIAFFLLAALVLTWTKRYVYVLALGMFAPSGYALISGSNGIPVFYAAALGAVAIMTLRFVLLKKPKSWGGVNTGRAPLIGFVLWCGLVTLMSPVIFKGIPVLTPRQETEYGYLDPGSLEHTVSNLAQFAYLVLCVSVVFFIGRGPRVGPEILAIGLSLTTVLSFAQICSYYLGLEWPDSFFVNNPSGRIIDGTTADGDTRFRGVYTEPSALAIGSLVSLTYFASLYPRLLTTWHRIGSVMVISMAITNLAVSTSSTAMLGAATLAVIVIAVGVFRFVFRRATIRPFYFGLILLAIVPVLTALGEIWSALQDEVTGKIGGTSYETRMGGNLMSFDVLVDTFFLGAGLGSHKPYALWATLIANAGLVGTVLFVTIVIVLVGRAWKVPDSHPVIWALVAVLVAKSYAGSGLGEPIVWMCLGMLANAVWSQGAPPLIGQYSNITKLQLAAHQR